MSAKQATPTRPHHLRAGIATRESDSVATTSPVLPSTPSRPNAPPNRGDVYTASPRFGSRSGHGISCSLMSAPRDMRASDGDLTAESPLEAEYGARTRKLRIAAFVTALAFPAAGVLGSTLGCTTNTAILDPAAAASDAQRLGVFTVSVLHNLLLLGFGGIGAVAARTTSGSWFFLVAGGLAFAGHRLYELLIDLDRGAVPCTMAGNWLRLGIAVGMVGIALALTPGRHHDNADAIPAARTR
jgi:hypothetical protein